MISDQTNKRRRVAPTVLIATLLACVPACQTSRVVTSDGRPMPAKPRRAPEVPAGAEPNRMTLLVVPRPDDTDGNGYPDTIQIASSLFSYPHPTAMEANGADTRRAMSRISARLNQRAMENSP